VTDRKHWHPEPGRLVRQSRHLGAPPLCGRADAEIAARVRHLKLLCEQHLAGRYTIEVIDLLSSRSCKGDQIVRFRRCPKAARADQKIIGDLSNSDAPWWPGSQAVT